MNTFTALADPTRKNIVEMLARRGQMSATDISRRFSSSPPAISQHLKVLREAKLVQMEKRAQKRLYSINPTGIDEIEEWLGEMRQLWMQQFDALDAYLKKEMAKENEGKRKKKRRQ